MMMSTRTALAGSCSWTGLFSTVVLLAAFLPGNAEAGPKGRRPCSAYPSNHFEVCYFDGADPSTGTYLGTESEPDLGTAPRHRTFGVDRNWNTGVIFANRADNISAVWVGRINFSGGKYHFTVFSSDGVRVYVDGVTVLDRWSNQGFDNNVIARQLAAGTHDIRIEWLDRPTSDTNDNRAHLRLHWDKAPERYNSVAMSPLKLDFFIMKEIQTCIAGVPWDGNPTGILCATDPDRACEEGDQLRLHNQDGSTLVEGGVRYVWQTNPVSGSLHPRGFEPSGQIPPELTLRKCADFGFTDAELSNLQNSATSAIYSFANALSEWTFGALQPTVTVHVVEPREGTLSQYGAGLWLGWSDLMADAAPRLTPETDFAFGLSSVHELNPPNPLNIRTHTPGAGGLTTGFQHVAGTGTGYSWVPDFFVVNNGALLHEWDHAMEQVIEELMGGGRLFDGREGETPYPACGTGGYNTLEWYPESHGYQDDSDSPWCDDAGEFDFGRGIQAHHLLHHFDPTLAHYGFKELTGNHCDNGVQDYGEFPEADSGETCSPNSPAVVTISSPIDGSKFTEGASITFVGSAEDPEDGNLTASLQWASDQVGQFGTGGSVTAVLPLGIHRISALVTDSGGKVGFTSIYIEVRPCKGPKCR